MCAQSKPSGRRAAAPRVNTERRPHSGLSPPHHELGQKAPRAQNTSKSGTEPARAGSQLLSRRSRVGPGKLQFHMGPREGSTGQEEKARGSGREEKGGEGTGKSSGEKQKAPGETARTPGGERGKRCRRDPLCDTPRSSLRRWEGEGEEERGPLGVTGGQRCRCGWLHSVLGDDKTAKRWGRSQHVKHQLGSF